MKRTIVLVSLASALAVAALGQNPLFKSGNCKDCPIDNCPFCPYAK